MRACHVASLGLAAMSSIASAQAVTSISGGSQFGSYYTSTAQGDVVGFRFEVTEAITVTMLGVWNADGQAAPNDGLTSEHRLGIWDDSENLLTETIAGPADTVIGDWTYAPCPSVDLVPGQIYTIGALYYSDAAGVIDGDSYVSGPSITTASEVTVLNAVFPSSVDLGFVFPLSDSFGNNGRYGPNFTFDATGDCACTADLTGDDCGTNTNDFFAFLALYQAQDPAADYSPGGGINTNDFFAYLAAYQADLNNPDCPG